MQQTVSLIDLYDEFEMKMLIPSGVVLLMIILLFVAWVPASISKESSSTVQPNGQPQLFSWLEYNNSNVFDNQMLEFFATHSEIVVLRGPLHSTRGGSSLADVVEGLHERAPITPVLLYFDASRLHTMDGEIYHAGRTASSVHLGMRNDASMLLKNPFNGKLASKSWRKRGRQFFADPHSTRYRQTFAARVNKVLAETNADGAAFDMAMREPFPKWCKRKPTFCKRYANGVDDMFKYLHGVIGGQRSSRPEKRRLTLFNGLWNMRSGQMESQEKLLHVTDGALIEFFGRRPGHALQPFAHSILPYIKVMQRYPNKTILVAARGRARRKGGRSKHTYRSYAADYRWQHYLYASYLMGAGPNTYFRYFGSFQMWLPARPRAGRSSQFSIFDDMTRSIGVPEGKYKKHGGLLERHFSHGVALVVPKGAKPAKYTLAHVLYDAEGHAYSGTLQVDPGEGIVLFEKSAPRTFNAQASGAGGGELTVAGADSWKYDALLNPVKTKAPSLQLTLRIRTSDPKFKLLVVGAVDDTRHLAMNAVTALSAGKCNRRRYPKLKIQFRLPHSTGPALPAGAGQISLNLMAIGTPTQCL